MFHQRSRYSCLHHIPHGQHHTTTTIFNTKYLSPSTVPLQFLSFTSPLNRSCPCNLPSCAPAVSPPPPSPSLLLCRPPTPLQGQRR